MLWSLGSLPRAYIDSLRVVEPSSSSAIKGDTNQTPMEMHPRVLIWPAAMCLLQKDPGPRQRRMHEGLPASLAVQHRRRPLPHPKVVLQTLPIFESFDPEATMIIPAPETSHV